MIISTTTNYVGFLVKKITKTLKSIFVSQPPDALLSLQSTLCRLRSLKLLAPRRASTTYTGTAMDTTQTTKSHSEQQPSVGLLVNEPSIPEIKIMSIPPTPTSTRSRRFPNHDTGFPEPFNGMRNTTLPHPDADISPNACISQDDLNVEMAMKRRRHSFLRKHRRTTSHGYVLPSVTPPTLSPMVSNIPPPLITADMPKAQADEARLVSSPLESSPRVSKEDSHSGGSARYDSELTPPTTPDDSKPQRRRSLLYRWRRK